METFNLNNQHTKSTGFQIPEGYFVQFSDKIQMRIAAEKKPKTTLFKLQKNTIFKIAAVFTIGFGSMYYWQTSNPYSNIDPIVLENYIYDSKSMTDNDLAEILDDNELDKLQIDLNITHQDIEKELIDNNDLEEYLLN